MNFSNNTNVCIDEDISSECKPHIHVIIPIENELHSQSCISLIKKRDIPPLQLSCIHDDISPKSSHLSPDSCNSLPYDDTNFEIRPRSKSLDSSTHGVSILFIL